MKSNQVTKKIKSNKLRCGSFRHSGNRMRPKEEFCKAKTPNGLSYSCKACRVKENTELGHDRYKRWKDRNPESALLVGARGNAKKKNLHFALTKKDIIIPNKCPILNIPLYISEKRTDNTPSVDRINNTKGYIPSNIIICSWRANFLKKDATKKELKKLSNFYNRRKYE